eukprot:50716-Hanusia_phi.AAC.1
MIYRRTTSTLARTVQALPTPAMVSRPPAAVTERPRPTWILGCRRRMMIRFSGQPGPVGTT